MRFFRLRPMALFGLAFFLCSVSATYLDRLWSVAGAAAAALAFFAALAVFALRRTDDKDKKQTRLAIASLLLAPALALSLAAWRSWRSEAVVPADRDVHAVCVVRSRYDASSGSAQYILAVRSVDGDGASFKASAFLYDRSFTPGDVLEVDGTFEPLGGSNPDGERRLRSLGAVAEADLVSVRLVGEDNSPASVLGRAREKIAARIAGNMDENAPLVTALVTGDRSDLDPELRRDFAELGIAHLLALSGVHMSVIAGAVAMMTGPSSRRRYYAIIPAVLLYAAISGFAASAVRAAAMLVICSLAGLFGRRTDTISLVALAASVIIIVSPGAAWDVGFLLSVLSVTALAVLPVRRLAPGEDAPFAKRLLRAVVASVAATVAVSIVTLPVTAREFGAISLAAPLANLIFIPLVTLILYAAPIYLAATFVPYLGAALGSALEFYCSLVVRLARWMSGAGALVSLDRPGFTVTSILLSVFFFAALAAKKRRFPAACACVAAAAMVLSGAVFELARRDEVSVTAVSRGAGDAIAATDGSELFVVDCARGNSAFIRDVEALRRSFAATRIEKYVFTHCHADSDAYLRRLLASEEIGEVVLPTPQSDEERDVCMRMAQIALDAGVMPVLPDGAVSLGAASLEMRTLCETAAGTEPVFEAAISFGEREVRYVSGNYFAAPEIVRLSAHEADAQTTIVGSHAGALAALAPQDTLSLSALGEFSATWKK